MDFDAVRLGTGIALVAGTSGASVTLPPLSSGINPRYVRLSAATEVFFRFESIGTTANVTTTDTRLNPNFPEVFVTGGNACISAKTAAGNTTISVTSIET